MDTARQHTPSQRKKRQYSLWHLIFFLVILAAITVALYLTFFLPSPKALRDQLGQQASFVITKQGDQIHFKDSYAPLVFSLPNYGERIIQAILASEDHLFRTHNGVRWDSLARGLLGCLLPHWHCSGGSTITMQLARMMYLSHSRNGTLDIMRRKALEIVLAYWIEQHLTKEEILSLYLNNVVIGPQLVGLEVGARYYFHKSARQLALQEAAILAGTIQRPSRNILQQPERAKVRGQKVMERMLTVGFITANTMQQAQTRPVRKGNRPWRKPDLRYIRDFLKPRIQQHLANAPDGQYWVNTTIVPELQLYIEKAKNQHLRRIQDQPDAPSQGAVIALSTRGEILALDGGSPDEPYGINYGLINTREPGSLVKPILLAAAMAQEMPVDTKIHDTPVRCRGRHIGNYDGTFFGQISLRNAVIKSRNPPFIRLYQQLNERKLHQLAAAIALPQDYFDNCFRAIGSGRGISLLDMMAAYVPFAADGQYTAPYIIKGIRNHYGRWIHRAWPDTRQAMSSDVADAVNAVLSDVIQRGTGKAADLSGVTIRGKTGSGQKSAWFVGYAGRLVIGVMVAHADWNRPLLAYGSGMPARIFRDAIEQTYQYVPHLITQSKRM